MGDFRFWWVVAALLIGAFFLIFAAVFDYLTR